VILMPTSDWMIGAFVLSVQHRRSCACCAEPAPCGSLPIRVSAPFEGSRKLGKTHQNVLVFCKGDRMEAATC